MSLGSSLLNMLGQQRDAFIILICKMGGIIMSSSYGLPRGVNEMKCKALSQCLTYGGCRVRVAEMPMVVDALSECFIKRAGQQWGAPGVGDGG